MTKRVLSGKHRLTCLLSGIRDEVFNQVSYSLVVVQWNIGQGLLMDVERSSITRTMYTVSQKTPTIIFGHNVANLQNKNPSP